MKKRMLFLIDGENIVCRYQAMLEAGAIPCFDTTHIRDVFVWNNRFFGQPIVGDVLRVVFYASVVGDDRRVREVREMIQKEMYSYGDARDSSWERLNAVVVKKERNSRKTKTIDMRICIDALAHTMNQNMDILHLVTGDADYVPLIEEVMRHGIRVKVHALSDGCAASIRTAGDSFTLLDDVLFTKKGSPKARKRN